VGIDLFNPLKKELYAVGELINRYLEIEAPEITELNNHTVQKKGKRLRPAISILFGQMSGYDVEKAIMMGTCFELLHTSTLIHDDVIDNAETRRGQQTHNNIWNNCRTVLYGDFVFSSAMRLAVDIGSLLVLDKISTVTRELVSGELLQLSNAFKFPPTREKYYQIIKMKTAVMFGGCCELPVMLSDNCHLSENARKIGEEIGYTFQIIDDCLDYTATDKKLGKPKLIDLKEGKATLPVLLAFENNDSDVIRITKDIFENKDISHEQGEEIVTLLEDGSYIEESFNIARSHVKNALHYLEEFPDCQAKTIFKKICQFIVERDF
jgi:octaprenyl-diphosphate synthase